MFSFHTWIPFEISPFLALAAIFGVPATIEILLRRVLDKRIRGPRKRSLVSLGLALFAFFLMFSWYLSFCGNCAWAMGFLKIGLFAAVIPTAMLGFAVYALREIWLKIRDYRFARYVRVMFMLSICLVLSSISSRFLPLMFLALIWGIGLLVGTFGKPEQPEMAAIDVISWGLGVASFIVFFFDWILVVVVLEYLFF